MYASTVCIIVDLKGTQNVLSEAYPTLLRFMTSYDDVITMQSQYYYT